jgi:hypothetical protein
LQSWIDPAFKATTVTAFGIGVILSGLFTDVHRALHRRAAVPQSELASEDERLSADV